MVHGALHFPKDRPVKEPLNITVTCDDLYTRVRWEDAQGVRYLINCKPGTAEPDGRDCTSDARARRIKASDGIIVRKWATARDISGTAIDGTAKANAATVAAVLQAAAGLIPAAIQAKAEKEAAELLARRRKRLDRLTEEMVACKVLAAELLMPKTVAALDAATKVIGYERIERFPR
jgi:hypothetical protein